MCEVKRGNLYIPNTGSRDLIVIEHEGDSYVGVVSLFSGDSYKIEVDVLEMFWEQVGTISD